MGKPKRSILAAAEASTTPPDALQPNHTVARVIRAEGNSLFVLELPDKTTILAEMADRFRNTIWMRRGGYVLVEKWAADKREAGRKTAGEIANVVRDEKEWRKQSYWPKEFVKNTHNLDDEDDDSNVGKMPPSDSEEEAEN